MTLVRSVRRRRIVLAWLIRLAVVVAFLLAWRAPSVSVLTRQSDAATVESYEAVYELAADGALVVTEQLVVDLPPGKRGIFRIFDTVDPRRSEVDHPVEVVSVTRDGVREPWVWSESAAGTRTMRIGDENLFIGPGEFTYRIVSRTVDALEPVEADGSTTAAWWWDVVGSGWSMPMESVTVKATLPAVPRSVECVQGVDTPCTARTEGAGFSVTTGPLDPFTPVTTRATFPPGALPVPPGSPTAPTTLLAVVAGLLAAAAGAALWFSTRERAPGFPVLFEPPAGVGPATGFRVLAEEDSTDDLQATLFELGGRGVVTLSSSGSDWVVERVGDPGAVTLTPEAQMVLDGLGLDGPGDRFTVADIPGLVEGAHAGKGLGHDFLRHIERCAVLLFVIDAAGTEGREPAEDYRVLRKELRDDDPGLARRPFLVVANKADLPATAGHLASLRQASRKPILPISAMNGKGVPELIAALRKTLPA